MLSPTFSRVGSVSLCLELKVQGFTNFLVSTAIDYIAKTPAGKLLSFTQGKLTIHYTDPYVVPAH